MSNRALTGKPRDTVLVTGYARLPEAEGKGEHTYFGCTFEVDVRGDVIVDAECTCSFGLGRDFFTRLTVGKSLTSELTEMIQEIEARTALPSTKTIVRSVQNAYNRYREFKFSRVRADARTSSLYQARAIGDKMAYRQ